MNVRISRLNTCPGASTGNPGGCDVADVAFRGVLDAAVIAEHRAKAAEVRLYRRARLRNTRWAELIRDQVRPQARHVAAQQGMVVDRVPQLHGVLDLALHASRASRWA